MTVRDLIQRLVLADMNKKVIFPGQVTAENDDFEITGVIHNYTLDAVKLKGDEIYREKIEEA